MVRIFSRIIKRFTNGTNNIVDGINNGNKFGDAYDECLSCIGDPNCSSEENETSCDTAINARQEAYKNLGDATNNLGSSVPGTSRSGPIPTDPIDLTTGIIINEGIAN